MQPEVVHSAESKPMNFTQIYFGGDYNPEQWPEEVWAEDARLMQQAGVNLVSLGIFAWARIEPRPGVFDFAWLDRLMDLLHAHGVAVNLATPTAAPPAWMVRLHPEMLPVTADGVTLWQGSRRHYCPHNPDYRRYARRVAAALAERYKSHPALTMWHVDNEYGCHVGECFCPRSAAAFRDWLRARYATLAELNAAWGTAFWSQTYTDWEEIEPPRTAPAQKNPAQQLDWARFTSDSWLACFQEQRDVLKAAAPDIPVTTNFMSFHRPIDYFEFARHEDVVSIDSYPDTSDPGWAAVSAMTFDLIRSLRQGEPWILMEQAASQVNWRQRNAVKKPGVMRLGSLQAVARGANGILFFQWRQSRAGAEKFHSAMLPHAGTESRTWREVQALGHELPRLNALLGGRAEAQVAILMDWHNWWALELDSKPSNDLKLLPDLRAWHRALYRRNIPVDFAHPESDLSRYRLVIAPHLYLVSDAAAANLSAWVERGGVLLMDYFSGIVDPNEQIRPGSYPAPFRGLLGLEIEEFVPYSPEGRNSVLTADGRRFETRFWADMIHLRGAEALARFEQDYFAGSAAVTRNAYSQGSAYYLGAELEPAGLEWLLERALAQAEVQPVLAGLPEGVEAQRRADSQREWLFLLNHNATPARVRLPVGGRDLLSGQAVSEEIELPAGGAAVIETVIDRSRP